LALTLHLDGREGREETVDLTKKLKRRFQIKGEKKGILVVDDYGHHPVEIMATLKAARTGWKRRIVVVFQPHRYSRTRQLLDRFGPALAGADELVITDILPVLEKAKELNPEIMAILVLATSSRSIPTVHAIRSSADDYLFKPFGLAEIEMTVPFIKSFFFSIIEIR
jgi:UDP-N-acetylmuramate--alanine ligase